MYPNQFGDKTNTYR